MFPYFQLEKVSQLRRFLFFELLFREDFDYWKLVESWEIFIAKIPALGKF
jgi:hypothetical protein